MMTTMAALLGGVPLALGSGTGSELRRPLGITIVGGLIVSQVLTLYTTPVVYLCFDRLARRCCSAARPARSERPRTADPAAERVMSLSAPFIRRPVATTLLTVGARAGRRDRLPLLPVAPLPQVDFPTIQCRRGLAGRQPGDHGVGGGHAARAAVRPHRRRHRDDLVEPARVSTSITLQFDLNRDIDAAARDVQAAINAARGQLPANLPNNPQLPQGQSRRLRRS